MIELGQPYSVPDASDRSMWRWAENNIVLSMRVPSRRRGAYRTDPTIYVRGIFDVLDDPRYSRVSVMKGAQTGLTLMAYCALCYWICEDPDPALLVWPSRDMARSKSESELQPLIEGSPRVAAELTGVADDFKKTEYHMRRCSVHLVGANSPANLASRPIRRLFLDELDKYPVANTREADPVSLAIERTKTYQELAKVIEYSTPTTKTGYIYGAYMIGDRRQFMFHCVHCRHRFRLRFEHVKWDHAAYKAMIKADGGGGGAVAKVAQAAYIECPGCKRAMDSIERDVAVSGGEWEATAKPDDPRHCSFQVPALLSPWVTTTDVCSGWLKAREFFRMGNRGPMQNVINSTFAEIWTDPPKSEISVTRIDAIARELVYERFTIPTESPTILIATTDVQSAHLVYQVWAMDPGNMYLTDYGYLATIDDIHLLRTHEHQDLKGRTKRPVRCFLDTGYNTMRMYEECLRHSWLVPIKGEQGKATRQTRPVMPSKIDSFPGGKMFGGNRSLVLYHVHPSHFKDQLSQSIEGTAPVKIWFPKCVTTDKDFKDQMTAEVVRDADPDKYGNVEQYWEKVRTNDFWDCAQYAMMARHLATNDLLKIARAAGGANDDEDSADSRPNQPEKPKPASGGVGAMMPIDHRSVSL